MRRRVRLTEGQLRDVVEESSRRVIQEMVNEGFLGDLWDSFVAKEMAPWKAAGKILNGGNVWDAYKESELAPYKSLYNSGTGKAVRNAASSAWNGIKNLFGGGDDNDVAEQPATSTPHGGGMWGSLVNAARQLQQQGQGSSDVFGRMTNNAIGNMHRNLTSYIKARNGGRLAVPAGGRRSQNGVNRVLNMAGLMGQPMNQVLGRMSGR